MWVNLKLPFLAAGHVSRQERKHIEVVLEKSPQPQRKLLRILLAHKPLGLLEACLSMR